MVDVGHMQTYGIVRQVLWIFSDNPGHHISADVSEPVQMDRSPKHLVPVFHPGVDSSLLDSFSFCLPFPPALPLTLDLQVRNTSFKKIFDSYFIHKLHTSPLSIIVIPENSGRDSRQIERRMFGTHAEISFWRDENALKPVCGDARTIW